jgi:hypothetical protein
MAKPEKYDEVSLVLAFDEVIENYGMMGVDRFPSFVKKMKDKFEDPKDIEEKAEFLFKSIYLELDFDNCDIEVENSAFKEAAKQIYYAISKGIRWNFQNIALKHLPDQSEETITKASEKALRIYEDFQIWDNTPTPEGDAFRAMAEKAEKEAKKLMAPQH